MCSEVPRRAYYDTMGRYFRNVECQRLYLGKSLGTNGQKSDAVPDMILRVLWLGTFLLRNRFITLFQNPRVGYVAVPGTVPKQT